ncbi:hypothetical protein [Pedobacter sp. L105]|uniref:hypothetical protein n=1 Tax=Pedobacter sp. L105 TaxID=1641871 RepID=UPI00131CE87E|nr:hypothetical protein [Pedobacter sp. L105]
MNEKGGFGLNYAEDFTIACAINYLKREEVLQYFINRVSFYAFNGGEMEAVALWATGIVIECKEAYGSRIIAVTDKKVQRISVKYVTLLSELSASEKPSTVDKMKESFYLMQEWETEMMPLVDYPKTFGLDEDNFLMLTFDFNLLCRMNGVNPNQVLQYFIDHISLAIQRAVNLLEYKETDSTMSLFGMMLLSRSMQKNKLPVQQDVRKWYSERLLELDERLKKETVLEKRISVYKAFYAEWFQSLMKNLN